MHSLKLNPLILLATPIIIAALFSYYLQAVILNNKEYFTFWLSSFGPYIILVYILLQSLTVIIAPLGGFFLVVAMIALFGPTTAIALAYLVTAPCYLVNFYLAKKYGRPLVEKIIGKTTMLKIDHYVQDAGTTTLIILRILQSGYFDYLAYGLGLTKIPFKTFAIVNFLAGIPGAFIIYFVITRFENLTYGIIAFYITTAILAGSSIYINHQLHQKRKKLIDKNIS